MKRNILILLAIAVAVGGTILTIKRIQGGCHTAACQAVSSQGAAR